jgi:3'(2'), 5'-bisphosphate nucleotidase
MYQRELQAALEAARLSGNALREAYERFQAVPDAPADISTQADRDSQEIILTHLQQTFPADALCAEEKTEALSKAAHTGSRLWIVDPIDGTRGFARKNGEFSVMIAFVHEGRPAVGVVLEPARDRLTYAVLGQGCWRQDGEACQADARRGHASQPIACRVSAVAELAASTLTQSHSRAGRVRSRQVDALSPARIAETYSAGIKLALVARGEADLYLNTYEAFHDWDICAGHILVREAGGKVTGLAGQELRYGLPGAWQRNGLLASNGLIHDAAVQSIAASSKQP